MDAGTTSGGVCQCRTHARMACDARAERAFRTDRVMVVRSGGPVDGREGAVTRRVRTSVSDATKSRRRVGNGGNVRRLCSGRSCGERLGGGFAIRARCDSCVLLGRDVVLVDLHRARAVDRAAVVVVLLLLFFVVVLRVLAAAPAARAGLPGAAVPGGARGRLARVRPCPLLGRRRWWWRLAQLLAPDPRAAACMVPETALDRYAHALFWGREREKKNVRKRARHHALRHLRRRRSPRSR